MLRVRTILVRDFLLRVPPPRVYPAHFLPTRRGDSAMRGVISAVAFVVGLSVLAAMGCAQDKYHMNPKHPEEPFLPPNEKRYNEPETAPYRKPLEPLKDEKALLSRPT